MHPRTSMVVDDTVPRVDGVRGGVAAVARAHGFDLIGVTTAEPLAAALAALTAWCSDGHAADLAWMTRNPPQRADPRTLLAAVRSLVSVAVPYGAPSPPFVSEGRHGRIARYAWGRDYHDVLLPRLRALAADLADRFGARRTHVACDHSPLLERAAAVRAGLGFFGKNTCLILPRRGSCFCSAKSCSTLIWLGTRGCPPAHPQRRCPAAVRADAVSTCAPPELSSPRSCSMHGGAFPTGRSSIAARFR